MNYRKMTDLELYKYRNQASNDEIFRRHKNYIYKQSHNYFKSINFKIPIEDIIQEMTICFFEIIPKIDLKRIKNLENFNFVIYMPYFFMSFKTKLLKEYSYELNQVGIHSIKGLRKVYFDDEIPIFIDQKKQDDLLLFKFLETKLSKVEYQIIYRFFVLKDKKKDIAEELNMIPSLFTHHFQRILKKCRYILRKEENLLYN